MISFQEEEAHIRMAVQKAHIAYKIDMHLKKNRTKGIAVNGIPIKKAKELFGIVNFVFFFSGGFKYCERWAWREKKIHGYGTLPAG